MITWLQSLRRQRPRFFPALLATLAFCATLQAGTLLDFEGFADGTVLTTQYAGVTFTDATVLSAGIGLNEFEFPPHSGTNVVFDDGGPISIAFETPVASFSGYFTYAEPLTLAAFGALGDELATASSAFSSNDALFGDPGSSRNEVLRVAFAGGISSVTITGDPAGGSFVMDDASFTSDVPEPGTNFLLFTGLLFVVPLRLLILRVYSNVQQNENALHSYHFLAWYHCGYSLLSGLGDPGVIPNCGGRPKQLRHSVCWVSLITSTFLRCIKDWGPLRTTRIRTAFVSTVVLFSVAARLYSAPQPITLVSADPPGIAIGVEQQLTFTALVGRDPSLILSSVNLIRYDTSPPTILSQMYDDGTHGDAAPGDGVFTVVIKLAVPVAGQVPFAVSAAYKGAVQRVVSSTVLVQVFSPPSISELQLHANIEASALQIYHSSADSSGLATAKIATLEFLQSAQGIVAAQLSADGNVISIHYSDGRVSDLLVGPPDTNSGPPSKRRATLQMLRPASSISAPPLAHTTENALILAPFNKEFTNAHGQSGDSSDLVAASFASLGIPVTELKDQQVTLETFRTLNQYSIVSLTTHGYNVNNQTFIFSGDIYTVQKASVQPYLSYVTMDLVRPCTPSWPSGAAPRFCVSSKFIEFYARRPAVPNGFPGTIFVTDACDSSARIDLEQAFLNNGATAFFGWTAGVSTEIGAGVMRDLANILTTQVNDSYPDTQSAYNALPITLDLVGGQNAKFVVWHHGSARSLNVWKDEPPQQQVVTTVSGTQPNDGVDQAIPTFSPAFSFTTTEIFKNVSISISAAGSGVATAYLTKAVGPRTTLASQVAAVRFQVPSLPYSWDSANLTLFSGLTLQPGQYYVTFASSSGGVVVVKNGSAATSPGISIGSVYYSSSIPPYPAAASYALQGGSVYYLPVITITGTLVVSAPPPSCAVNFFEIPESSFVNTSHSYDANGWIGFHFTASGTRELLIGGNLRSSVDCSATVVSLPDYYMAQMQDGLQYTIQWYAYDNGTAATWKLVRDSDGAVLFDALTNGNWVERKYTAGYGCDNTVSAYWSGTWLTGTVFPCQFVPAPRQ